MTSSNSSGSNSRALEERVDFLLSVELDDELSSAERDELEALRRDSPDLIARLSARQRDFDAGDTVLRRLAGAPVASTERAAPASAGTSPPATTDATFEASLENSFAAIRARLADEALDPAHDTPAPIDELAKRPAARSWVPPVVLAAAAAWVLYLVVPTSGPPSVAYLEAETASRGSSPAAPAADEGVSKSEEVLRDPGASPEKRLAQAEARPAPALVEAEPRSGPAPSVAREAAPAPNAPSQLAKASPVPSPERFERARSADSLAAAESVLGDLASAARSGLAAAPTAARQTADAGLATLRDSSSARTDDGLEPLELAIVFGTDEAGNDSGFDDGLTAEDFEIIEQLELLEYLATQSGGRG